jgi:hypothetical protein
MKAYTFEDFQVGMMVINDHEVVVVEVIAKGDKYTSGRIKASVDGGKARLYRLGDLCEALGVETAKVRTGRTSGTKVVSTKTEEERIEAKARLAFKDATKGLEAMEAAGLLTGKALATAKKELEAKIKTEQERLTAEAVAAKAKKAEEQATKKAAKAAASKFEKAAKALDTFSASALKAFLKVYIDTREDAKAIIEVVTKAQELDDARNEELGQMYGFNE